MNCAIFIAVSLLLVSPAFGQQSLFADDQFDKAVLSYHPAQRSGVTDVSYAKGLKVLDETRSGAKSSSGHLDASDYWNLGSAFIALGEPADNVRMAFNKALRNDPARVCSYLKAIGPGRYESTIRKQ